MADIDISRNNGALIAVVQTGDVVVTLNPRSRYRVYNLGANIVYGQTDGASVTASDAQAADKFKLLVPATGIDPTVELSGVTTLALKSTVAGSLVNITKVGDA